MDNKDRGNESEERPKMKTPEVLANDIDWIKETLVRIDERLEKMEQGCVSKHTDIDKDLSAIKQSHKTMSGITMVLATFFGGAISGIIAWFNK